MPSRSTERINFGKIKEIIAPPNLIELQTNSYKEFLQADVAPVQAQEPGPAGRVHRGLSHRKLRRQMRPRFPQLRNRRAQARLAGMPARRPDLRRAALRHLPAQGGKEHQGRKGVHGRTAADDPAGHVRHQRRRARHRQPAAPFARPGLRGNPASQRQEAPVLPHHPRPRFLVRGPVRHQRFALRLSRPQETPPQISDHHVLPRPRLRLGRGHPQAVLRHRGPDASRRPRSSTTSRTRC